MKYCVKCGSILSDSDSACANCGASTLDDGTAAPEQGASTGPNAGFSDAGQAGAAADTPPKYLPWSIVLLVVSVIFCLITGLPGSIVALVYGGKVDSLMGQGKADEAWRASKTAKYWLIASTAVTGGLILISVIAIIALVAYAAAKS
jgi:hypothetical protein